MRTVSSAFQTAIAAGGVRLCELYEAELANGTVYRYTDHDCDITWDAAGNTYTAIPIRRGPIRFNTDGQFDEFDLTLAIRSLAVLDQIKYNILEAVKITHKRIRWDASYAADEEIVLGIWVPDVDFNASGLSLRLKSYLDSLTSQVPAHTYQEPCNNFLFDPTCGLARASYAYSSTATAGTRTTLTDANAGTLHTATFDGGDDTAPLAIGDTITGSVNGYTAEVVQIVYLTSTTGTIWYCELSNALNFVNNEVLSSGGDSVTVQGTVSEDTSFYEQGELEITSGNNSGERRPILSSSGSVRTVLWPFPQAIGSGDGYRIYPGCDFRPATCQARFDNAGNWRGFPWIPPWEETAL
jgi:hypothetical protein